MRPILLPLFCCVFGLKTQAQFSSTIQNLTESSSAKMHGMSLHDLDADGDLDILATFTDGVVSFENDGAGNFLPEKTWFEFDLSNLNYPLPARFADLDGDSLPDLAANKSWRKNLGNGQFAAAVPVFSNPLAGLADVDADGWPDAIHYNSNTLYWQKNGQNGAFLPSKSIGSGANWQFWAVADLNSDGFSDLVLSRNYRFYWYKNLKNGTFEGIQLDASFPKQAIVGDVDMDSRADLIAGFGSEIRWLTFDSLGAWTLRQAIPVSIFQGGLALGDSDGDGDRDLVVGDFDGGSGLLMRWFRMLPTGLFSTTPVGGVSGYPDGYNRNIVALGDLNGNAEIDLVAGSNIKINSMWLTLDDSIPGNFGPKRTVGAPLTNIYQILMEDLDLDGDRDLVAANFLLEKTGIGQFAARRRLNFPDRKVQFADLDGDTLPDAIYPFGNSVAWQRNLGNFQFGAQAKLDELIFLNKDVGIADLDSDGDLDLFAANGTDAPTATASARWYENDGAGNFTGHLLATDIQWCSDVYSLDFNEDGRLDIFLLLGAPDADLWFENLGGGNFSAAKTVWPASATEPDGGTKLNQKMLVDLNKDGRLDLVFSTRDYGIVSVYWYQNLGGGAFSDRKNLLNISQNASAGGLRFAVFDATGDGILDIAVSLDYARQIEFLKGLGNGNFASAQSIADDDGFSGFDAIANYDVDDDGLPDLVFGNADAENGGKNALSWLGGMKLSGAVSVFENADFRISPNPVSAGQTLQIFGLEKTPGDFRVQILALDGRVLGNFGPLKTPGDFEVRVLENWPTQFVVRVLDEKGTAARLVFKF